MTALVINYLKLSKIPVGYLINFTNARLERLKPLETLLRKSLRKGGALSAGGSE